MADGVFAETSAETSSWWMIWHISQALLVALTLNPEPQTLNPSPKLPGPSRGWVTRGTTGGLGGAPWRSGGLCL